LIEYCTVGIVSDEDLFSAIKAGETSGGVYERKEKSTGNMSSKTAGQNKN
jgi:hypothetical protein